jgi:hypothetical protein
VTVHGHGVGWYSYTRSETLDLKKAAIVLLHFYTPPLRFHPHFFSESHPQKMNRLRNISGGSSKEGTVRLLDHPKVDRNGEGRRLKRVSWWKPGSPFPFTAIIPETLRTLIITNKKLDPIQNQSTSLCSLSRSPWPTLALRIQRYLSRTISYLPNGMERKDTT